MGEGQGDAQAIYPLAQAPLQGLVRVWVCIPGHLCELDAPHVSKDDVNRLIGQRILILLLRCDMSE